jgi:ABC-2 family transporter protein
MTGFARLARSELTKLVTVRRWLVGLAAMSVLTVGFGLLSAAGSGSDADENPDFVVGPEGSAVHDDLYLVHGTVTGDATVTARVTSQERSHPLARAGLMFKQSTTSGSRYASVAVTPDHGVLFDSDFGGDPDRVAGAAPRWLRLRREGSEVRGYASTDGSDWRLVGTADLAGVGRELEVGLFVSSPPDVRVTREAGSTSVGEMSTEGRATFEDVALVPAAAGDAEDWRGDQITGRYRPPIPDGEISPDVKDRGRLRPAGSVSEAGGVFTIRGSGEIGPAEGEDDSLEAGLFGTLFGLMALASVSVLFATSEYKRQLVWTTFAASPRRRPVLAAKAVVLAGTAFSLGLVTSVVAYFATRPVIRDQGLTLPAYAHTSIGQPSVIRALVGNAVLLTAFALLGLALGTILRRSSGAIALVFALGVVPLFAASIVPAASRWIMWLTPAGGFAVQRAKPPSIEVAEPWALINPWVGLGVACAYAAVGLAVAAWQLERRDA